MRPAAAGAPRAALNVERLHATYRPLVPHLLRPLRFGTVGAITALLNVGLLWLLKEAGLGAVVAYAIALALAVQFNFLASQAFIWGDRRLPGLGVGGLVERWLTFHSCIAASIGINMGAFVVARLVLPDLAAAVVAIAASTVVKFLSLDRFAFRDAPPVKAGEGETAS